jgi:hypothetical protein
MADNQATLTFDGDFGRLDVLLLEWFIKKQK